MIYSVVSAIQQSESVIHMASLVAQLVKNLPTVKETQVQYLGRENPLGKEVATHSSILAWIIPWRGAWQASPWGRKSQTQLGD